MLLNTKNFTQISLILFSKKKKNLNCVSNRNCVKESFSLLDLLIHLLKRSIRLLNLLKRFDPNITNC